MTLREGRTSPKVVTGMLFVFGYPIATLLDPGAMHSFISYQLAVLAPIPASPLPEMWRMYHLSGDVEQVGWVYLNCEIFVESFVLTVDLMQLDIVDFDVILGMDFLEAHRAMFDSHSKEVLFRSLDFPEILFVETKCPHRLVSFKR